MGTRGEHRCFELDGAKVHGDPHMSDAAKDALSQVIAVARELAESMSQPEPFISPTLLAIQARVRRRFPGMHRPRPDTAEIEKRLNGAATFWYGPQAQTDLRALLDRCSQLEAEVERLREAQTVALNVIDVKVGVYRRAAAEKAGTHTAITCRAAADALDEVRAALNTTGAGHG